MNKFIYAMLTLLGMILPFAVSSILVHSQYQVSLSSIHLDLSQAPSNDIASLFSDELYHWRQLETYAVASLDGGYYTVAENPAHFEPFRFYAWGPFPYILLGTFARILGVSFFSMILATSILWGLFYSVFVRVIRPDITQLLQFILLFIFFPGFILFFPTFMLEMLNYIVAICIATGIFLYLKNDNLTPKLNFILLMVAMIFILSIVVRSTWALVCIPLLSLFTYQKYKRGSIGLIAGVMVSLLSIYLWRNIAAPYPLPNAQIIATLVERYPNFLDMIGIGFVAIGFNIAKFVLFTNFATGSIRFAIVVFIVLLIYPLYQSWRNFDDHEHSRNWIAIYPELYFHAMNMFVILSFIMVGNYAGGYRDVRVIMPHMLLSLILLIAFNRHQFVIPILGIFILTSPFIVAESVNWMDIRFGNPIDIESKREMYRDSGIYYNAGQENGWCNTVLYHLSYFSNPDLLALDSGLGLTWYQSGEIIRQIPQSKYILIPDSHTTPSRWNLEPMHALQNATIYRNLDADCA